MLDGTYAGLQSSVGDFLGRSDLVATVPDFIRMFEGQFDRLARVAEMITATTLSISTAATALPADFNGIVSLELPTGSGGPLRYEKPDGLRAQRQTNYSAPGTPFLYTIAGMNVEVAPPPSQTFVCPLLYYARLPALSVSAPSNWLLTKHPDIYLYGSLLQSAPYLKDDGRVQVWGQFFQQGIGDLMASDGRNSYGHGLTPPVRGAAAPVGTAA